MAERCAFEGNCPMMADIIDLSGPCTDNRGEKCGPVAAYGALVYEMGSLSQLDIDAPIVGTFTFNTVPAGSPPEEIREEWLGVEVPVRYPDGLVAGDMKLSANDTRLSLLSQGRLKSALWFTRLALTRISFSSAIFQAREGEYAERDAVSSLDYYGSRISADVRATINES